MLATKFTLNFTFFFIGQIRIVNTQVFVYHRDTSASVCMRMEIRNSPRKPL